MVRARERCERAGSQAENGKDCEMRKKETAAIQQRPIERNGINFLLWPKIDVPRFSSLKNPFVSLRSLQVRRRQRLRRRRRLRGRRRRRRRRQRGLLHLRGQGQEEEGQRVKVGQAKEGQVSPNRQVFINNVKKLKSISKVVRIYTSNGRSRVIFPGTVGLNKVPAVI